MRVDVYTNMMNPGAAAEFATSDAAESYVLTNPDKMAIVVHNRIVVTTFYGATYQASK